MTGDKIRMKMAEEDVADLQAEFLCVGDVLLDVALRIDDDGGRTGLIAEQVGGVGEAPQVVLFQEHRCSDSLPQRGETDEQIRKAG